MLQFRKQLRVMETETIQKNEASPKSQMSRGNFNKKMPFALLVMSLLFCGLLFTSCGNSPSSAVRKALNACIKGDVERMINITYDVCCCDKEELRSGDFHCGIISFKIQNERIFDNGERAEVTVRVVGLGFTDTQRISLVKTRQGWKLKQ